MSTGVISNPILNSPFVEPNRHFKFDDEGITNEIVNERRSSSYFVPIPAARKRSNQQLAFNTEWTQDRIEENSFVNQVRVRIGEWRQSGYKGVTPTTRRLLEYWTNPNRERKLFFAQIEALETIIYLAECAKNDGSAWFLNELEHANSLSNPGLPRMAMKMATGSGKTVVMAMIIAWQALNKLESRHDSRFSDHFLLITPGITIRDRLRVLLPSDPENYYKQRDILEPWQIEQLNRAKFVITNFHAFQLREKKSLSATNKQILRTNETGAFTETPDEMVRRVCREFGGGKGKEIIVINDEAHHCYRRRPEDLPGEKLDREEKAEAKSRDEEARIWINGIEAVKNRMGVKAIYDLSATPFFLRGSGYSEGTLFPWVVSDFSLIDAIESGVVKVPRVPVDDNAMGPDGPMYRVLWPKIKDELPKKGRATDAVEERPHLPSELEAALQSLYNDYEKRFAKWRETEEGRLGGSTPPVFIVVCNNTNVSRMVFNHIAGWEKELPDGSKYAQAGELELFRNDDGNGGWKPSPYTILVDSQQLESGNAISDDFKKVAAEELELFREEYRRRFPGRSADDLTDSDLLREVMNTVGKPGKLGEKVRCVVSVSMLTEGWDANTVTHVLGVRAFGTQLLCEQVVGRALRRVSYVADENGMFDAEYAEVYGVPFSFIPSSGAVGDPKPRPIPTRVRALEDRITSEITFPMVDGYRLDIPDERLSARFTPESHMALSPQDLATITTVAGQIGEERAHYLADPNKREASVAFELAETVLDKYFRDNDGNDRPWLFPQLLKISRDWMQQCLTLKDDAFVGMLGITDFRYRAAEHIYSAITQADERPQTLWPILRPYDTIGSTRFVEFDTTKPTWRTDPDKCHISHVVADTNSWEQKTAQVLEQMPEVVRYAKNERLGFTIPYQYEGQSRRYTPDFIACIDDGHGPDDLLNLIIEVSGENRADKRAKVDTARNQWLPAVNNHGGFGRWRFIEITDPWQAESMIRSQIQELALAHQENK